MSVFATDDCIACSVCLNSCPNEAIDLYDDKAVFNQGLCTYCGECEFMCPVECIIVDDGGQGDSTFVFDDGLFFDVSEDWLGMDFGWGGEGPDSTDCSGLIWGVYTDMGYDYIRCATSEFSSSPSWIQVDSLQDGDIVVWPGTHSGIYYHDIFYGNRSCNLFYAGSNGVGWSTIESLNNFFCFTRERRDYYTTNIF